MITDTQRKTKHFRFNTCVFQRTMKVLQFRVTETEELSLFEQTNRPFRSDDTETIASAHYIYRKR